MDGDRFDRLTRGLLGGASRRSLFAGLFGGAVATVAGAELLEAKKGGKGRGKGRGKSRGNGNGNGNGGGDNGKKRTICHCPPGDPDNCHTIRVGKKAAQSHLRNHPDDTAGPCDDDQNQCLSVTGTDGEVTEESDGRFTLSTEGDDEQFGVLEFDVPAGTTFGELESIQTDFSFETGTCGGGSPRFVVFLENGNCPYVQFAADDCGTEGSTGELVGDNTSFLWIDDLQCDAPVPPSPVFTFDEILARYEDVEIESIALVVDESPQPGIDEHTVTVDACITVASS